MCHKIVEQFSFAPIFQFWRRIGSTINGHHLFCLLMKELFKRAMWIRGVESTLCSESSISLQTGKINTKWLLKQCCSQWINSNDAVHGWCSEVGFLFPHHLQPVQSRCSTEWSPSSQFLHFQMLAGCPTPEAANWGRKGALLWNTQG